MLNMVLTEYTKAASWKQSLVRVWRVLLLYFCLAFVAFVAVGAIIAAALLRTTATVLTPFPRAGLQYFESLGTTAAQALL